MANPQIEDGFTKIANEIIDRLALLDGINGTQWRCLLVVVRKTYGWNKKVDYISLSQFENATGIKANNCSVALRDLAKRNIIFKRSHFNKIQYGLNKNYDEWLNKKEAKDMKIPASRDLEINRLIRFWNKCAEWEHRRKIVGLVGVRKITDKLRIIISQKMDMYDYAQIRRAFWNYHRFMSLPAERKRFWQGYAWGLENFLKRGRDNCHPSQFGDWKFVEFNLLKPEIEKPTISLESAISLVQRETTSGAMEKAMLQLKEADKKAFFEWVKNNPDPYFRTVYSIARKIILNRTQGEKK